MKPLVTVTNIFPQIALDKLSAECDLNINRTSLTKEELKQKASGSDAIISYLINCKCAKMISVATVCCSIDYVHGPAFSLFSKLAGTPNSLQQLWQLHRLGSQLVQQIFLS